MLEAPGPASVLGLPAPFAPPTQPDLPVEDFFAVQGLILH